MQCPSKKPASAAQRKRFAFGVLVLFLPTIPGNGLLPRKTLRASELRAQSPTNHLSALCNLVGSKPLCLGGVHYSFASAIDHDDQCRSATRSKQLHIQRSRYGGFESG